MLDEHIKNNIININIFDNGIGIKDEIIDKIFKPYFTTMHQSQGNGMGLYIVHNIINITLEGNIFASNKTITIDNKKQIGTNFLITINDN